MPRLALVSDTHIPSRAPELPDWVAELIRSADHTVHAGDFDSAEAFETVRDLADGNLTAVAGNTDPAALDLPDVAVVSLGGATFVVTHGTGPRDGYRERVAETVAAEDPDADFGVAGHTHELLDEVVDGVRLLNPGSATGASPASVPTAMTVALENGTVAVTTHDER